MESKPKNREWVKNAAIIFLSVLLVLTFFSQTIMNRALPEVATQDVNSGSIVAKVRGTGTVTANGTHQVKAQQTREIRAVMVRVGQEVNAGDVLFVLGEGESSEIEAAQDLLRSLTLSYQRAAIGMSGYNYTVDQQRIDNAERKMNEAKDAMDKAEELMKANSGSVEDAELLKETQEALLGAMHVRDAYSDAYNKLVEEASAELNIKEAELRSALEELAQLEKELRLVTGEEEPGPDDVIPEKTEEELKTEIALKESEVQDKTTARDEAREAASPALAAISSEELDKAEAEVKKWQAKYDALLNATGGGYADIYKSARDAYEAAKDNYDTLVAALEERKATDGRTQAIASIELADLATQVENARKKLENLSGGSENQIVANVSGTIQTVDCTAGDTKLKDDILCTIEVPDMGYSLSFSVTNEQASRLRTGDTATVSNYYWGRQIVATLNSIRIDPKKPQTNKILTFDLDGDVNAGAELTISVGQKSANYDTIIPNSAIRSDSNGSFVLKVEAKNSPLGNRYIARRVPVEVLASDDNNSAVTGNLGWGDYVITTSSAPIKSGDLVRLTDS